MLTDRSSVFPWFYAFALDMRVDVVFKTGGISVDLGFSRMTRL